MERVNNIEITGNCVADAKIIPCKTGREKTVFRVAVNYPYTLKGGEKTTVTEYFNVETWHTSVRNIIKKGTPVIIRGFRTGTIVNEKPYFSIVANSVEEFVPEKKE